MRSLLVNSICDKLFNQIVEATADGDGLYILIDSYGGDLHAGYKIFDYLKAKENIYACVVGNCMSAAILVLLGVRKENRTANEHAKFLIHRPLLEYNGQLTQKIAQQVDTAIENETAQLMKVYAKELDASEAALFGMLDAEQVFGARQAQKMGFVSIVNEIEKQGEIEQAALLDVAYNQKLINRKMEKLDLNTCLEAIKNLFSAKMQNTKAISTADGEEIKVETDGDPKQGDKCDAQDGSYVLADNRTIVVKNGVIETIEEPKKEEEEKKEEKPAEPQPTEEPKPTEKEKELEEKVKNLTESETNLKAELQAANDELAKLQEVKNKMAEFEKVNNLINEAGGIDAVMGAFSAAPVQKSGEAEKNDATESNEAYSYIKNLG